MKTRYTKDVPLKKKLHNARVAWRATLRLWKEELSFRMQVVFAAFVVIASVVLNISRENFLIVVLFIGVVFAVEALNTAIEELCDHVTPEEHPRVGAIKDLGSAASLLIGGAAIIAGVIIFLPALLALK